MTLFYEKTVSLMVQRYQYMRCVSRAFCLEATFPAFVLSCTEHTYTQLSIHPVPDKRGFYSRFWFSKMQEFSCSLLL